MRQFLSGLIIAGLSGAWPTMAKADTIKLGEVTAATEKFGPGDMICDLNKCRLFNMPPDSARYSDRALIEFGFPGMSGQDRFIMRRCTGALCRATVSGIRTAPTSRPESANPTIFVVPAEIEVK